MGIEPRMTSPSSAADSPAGVPEPSGVGATGADELELQRVGKYRILRRLGRGGMATVYLAVDEPLDRQVALKVPHLKAGVEDAVLARFQREARAAAKLKHPGICGVHEIGQADGRHYIAMNYIEGIPLSEFTSPATLLPERRVAKLIRKTALAMHEAHRQGIVHRDLKPSNIMVEASGRPVVMDFGVALHPQLGDLRLTQSGAIVGTPAYMAPEQIDSSIGEVGPASDVYGLGIVLYELLCGRLPFEGDVGAVLVKIMTTMPVPPSFHRPEVDGRLEDVCLKAISREANQRYRTMAEFAEALSGYLSQAKKDSPSAAPAPRREPKSVEPPSEIGSPAKPRDGHATDPPDKRPTKSGTRRSSTTIRRPPSSSRRPRSRSDEEIPLGSLFGLLAAVGGAIVMIIAMIALVDRALRPRGEEPAAAPIEAAAIDAAERGPSLAEDGRTYPLTNRPIASDVPAVRLDATAASIQVEFPTLSSIGGKWESLGAEVRAAGRVILDDEHPAKEVWQSQIELEEDAAFTPVYSFAPAVIPAELRAPGSAVELSVRLSLAYPVRSGADAFRVEKRSLERQVLLVVPPLAEPRATD